MKSKRLIRFYFAAENLNAALDNIIMYYAFKEEDFCGQNAERIIGIIEKKSRLARLWGYLDGVMGGLGARELEALDFYGGLTVGIKKLPDDRRREVKRAVVKFTRHARFIESYGDGLSALNEYYCLL